MIWIVLIAVAAAVLLGVGMLIARRNPDAADVLANAAKKLEADTKSAVDQVKK